MTTHDAVQCFESLLDSVPGWLETLEEILQSSTKRLQKSAAASTAALRPILPSSSACSSTRCSASRKEDPVCSSRHINASNPDPSYDTPLPPRQRKRKSPSVVSSASSPTKYRSRNINAGYFDLETQTKFDKLVRSIGTVRNSLRKGKRSAKLAALGRRISSSSSSSSSSSGGDGGGTSNDEYALMAAKYSPCTIRRAQTTSSFLSRSDGTEVFDRVDALLEKAQTLCEKAAHQLLRVGDCAPEIRTVEEHMREAETAGQDELPGLRKTAARAMRRERRAEERERREKEEVELRRKNGGVVLETEVVVVEEEEEDLWDVEGSDADLPVDPAEEVDEADDRDNGRQFVINTFELSKFGARNTRIGRGLTVTV